MRLPIAFCGVLVIGLTVVRSATACSCEPPPPPRAALEAADAVFFGKVVRTRRDARDINQGHLFATFEVELVWKGDVGSEVVVQTAPNGGSCGIPFAEGDRYVVYGVWVDGTLHTHLCTRTALAERAQDDLDALGEPILRVEGEPVEEDGGGCGGPSNFAALQGAFFILLGVWWTRRRREESQR